MIWKESEDQVIALCSVNSLKKKKESLMVILIHKQ